MNSWIKKLLGRFVVTRIAPDSAPWKVEDMQNLKAFLHSPSGLALIRRMRATEYVNAIKGSQDTFSTVHSAGRTAGYSDGIAHLISLSSTCDAQQENNINTPDGEASVDDLSEYALRNSP